MLLQIIYVWTLERTWWLITYITLFPGDPILSNDLLTSGMCVVLIYTCIQNYHKIKINIHKNVNPLIPPLLKTIQSNKTHVTIVFSTDKGLSLKAENIFGTARSQLTLLKQPTINQHLEAIANSTSSSPHRTRCVVLVCVLYEHKR